jgi:hypothetical protein
VLNPRLSRVLAAIIAGCESAVVVYAVVRVAQAFLVAEPNPALVGPSVHHGYFWRVWIAVYCGGFVGLAIALFARETQLLAKTTLKALPWAAAIAITQAVLVP